MPSYEEFSKENSELRRRIAEQERQIAELKRRIAELEAQQPPSRLPSCHGRGEPIDFRLLVNLLTGRHLRAGGMVLSGRLGVEPKAFQDRSSATSGWGLWPSEATSADLAHLARLGMLLTRIATQSRPNTAGAAFRKALVAGDRLALGELVHPHTALGPFNFCQWAAFAGAHEARHAAKIKEIAA
jgi:hypothetical protein